MKLTKRTEKKGNHRNRKTKVSINDDAITLANELTESSISKTRRVIGRAKKNPLIWEQFRERVKSNRQAKSNLLQISNQLIANACQTLGFEVIPSFATFEQFEKILQSSKSGNAFLEALREYPTNGDALVLSEAMVGWLGFINNIPASSE